MRRAADRPDAVAVAAQVGRDHGELPGQHRGDPVPGGMGLRVAVQQQYGWAVATHHGVHLGVGTTQTPDAKAGKQRIVHTR
jgi:hypothetical protein